ncbi:MAG: CARDB domain-containing protein, partial [Candidatus Methanospirareceae archaeon]
DWAIATLAIASLGEDPWNFSGINFVGSLNSFFDGEQIGYEVRLDDDCFALLALSAAGGGEIGIVNRTVANLMKEQRMDGGWNFYGGNSSSVADTSLAIQAILSTGLVSTEDASIRRAIEFVKSNQDENGSFPYNEGEEGSSIPTALALSALLASNRSENRDSIEDATDYLLKVQNEEGYFHDYDRIKSTSYAVIALSGEHIPSFHQIVINKVLPEIYPVAFTVRPGGASDGGSNDTAYANVTNDVIARIRNNGGAFNLSFIEDGETLQERRVIEKRSTAETEVKFEWKPVHTGEYNLTISADTNEEIEEANEGNNTIMKGIMVMLPDLHPDLSFIDNRTFYSNFSNDFQIEVKGFGENFNSSILVNFVDNITNNFTYNITNITCYGEAHVNFTWKPEFRGNYSFRVTIDCDDDVKESDEENNRVVGVVNVRLPDILPCNISFLPPASASLLLVNKSNQINVSLRGAGENFNVSLYAYPFKENETEVNDLTSLANLTNDSSIFIGKRRIPGILGLENISFSWIPGEEGFYRVFVVADADNDVYEANETNNVWYADIEVTLGAPEIRLIEPRGGETFINRDYIDVRWNARDPDDDPLNISIGYSPDRGRSWIKIAEDEENDGCYSWCIEDMPDGEYILKVEASDGNFTDSDTTVEPFTICSKESHEETLQFHYNAGFSLSEAPDTNAIAWNTTDIGAVDSSQPIVAAGKVFVYCDNDTGTFLVALNESEGKFIRRWELDKRQYGSWSSPGYHAGKVFIGSGKKIYAIDVKSGEEKWVATLPKEVVNSCPTIADGKVFIGGYGADGDPGYYCLDEEEGTILWVFNKTDAREIGDITNPRATATPTFYEGRVFVGFASGIIGSSGAPGAIYCLRENGTAIWNVSTDYGVWGSITAIHGILYFGTYNFDGDATYYAMYPADGGVRWEKEGIRTDSTPAYAYGNMYISGGCIGHSGIATYCLNPEDGGEIWKVEGIGGWTASPVVSSDGKLIVGRIGKGGDASAADGTYCLDAVTGEEIWSSPYGGSTAVIANGRVYTIGQGKVWCFGSFYTPDLNISSFDAPEKVYVGENVVVNVTVKNIGNGDVNESFNVSLRANGEDVGIETISSLNT